MVTSLEERFWAKVDRNGPMSRLGTCCWVWTGCLLDSEYGQFWNGQKLVRAHRMAWQLSEGPVPEGLIPDHRCHNHSCVRFDHLRLATWKQNLENRSGPNRNSTSGVQGVSWMPGRNKWRARVRHNGRDHFAGHFDDLHDAEAAAIAKRNELYTFNDLDRTM
jgi:hypothetical protein